MIPDALRPLWTAPRAPGAPARVWRDWVLVALLVPAAVLEGVLRPDVTWRPVALVLALVVVLSLLWRRTHPLGAILAVFGTLIVVDTAALVGGVAELGLYTTACVLLLPYALCRWGSGREVVLGLAAVLVATALGIAGDYNGVAEAVLGVVFILTPAAVGAWVRLASTSRLRERDQVRLREREQLARELHDTVAHHVSAIAVRAQAGRVVAATDPSAALDALVVIEKEASRALTEMRLMVSALRDDDAAELAPQRGVADIERLAAGGPPRVAVELSGDLDGLRPAVGAALYRLAQESVTNALRHARYASQVSVAVAADEASVRLTVVDDGELQGRTGTGYGLVGMTERASLLGGTLDAGPGAERGWTVVAVLPRTGAVA
ncbi:sensor histidine kinase [Cellulomonas humilata]|uniref:histidine kinase n=1 Tax=Cellulomonas humilata TaxID=144055 RepID=A0ABU0EG79_9CELL|nr:histidine kinase [Cellulomonas humilata]MDQ0374108.1 signal transduction histidine kinase [Cellulomonas humilata]